ncbi:MAG: SPASM domain-containing protein, partial [Candidatus Omnitrophica bacterium]|nr:SPASM domain-containing protein [Candidatus Omnitrophota bacterium]
DDERFIYGNINEQTFREIWEGEKRKKSLCWVENEFDASNCRINCRMDKVNKYLHALRDNQSDIIHDSQIKQEHVNFI